MTCEGNIMTFYEFIQWCFRSSDSSFMTLLIIGAFFAGVIGIIKALKGKE